MSKRRPRKLNVQAILDIIKKNLVWPELEGLPDAIHYYHLTDTLGRKWQTIGCHVTDAIKVFNVNYYSIFTVLYDLKNDYLLNDPVPISDFEAMYKINPIEALSRFYLENVDTLDYWEWIQAGGSAELAVNFRKANPTLTLIEAIEKAERMQEVT